VEENLVQAILSDFSAVDVAKAIEDNAIECCLSWAQWPRMNTGADQHIVWTLTDVPFPFFNNVFRPCIPAAQVHRTIEEVLDRARHRSVPLYWWNGPTTRPADLGRRLEERGFVHGFEASAMAIDLLSLDKNMATPDHLFIEEVSDPEKLRAWCAVMTNVYEFPSFAVEPWFQILIHLGLGPRQPFRHFLASCEGKPVATASLFLGSGVGGVSSVATVPEHRRQGIATSITVAALRQARNLGYRIGVLFSSPMGVGVYQQLGFREYGKGDCYVWMEGVPP
jgi:GNAT superfamily N-acetyltransferase